MKSIFLVLVSMTFVNIIEAQIVATTSSGKKVYLFSNGTWKYADNTKPEEIKACATNHTGNVTFKNNTDKDLYIYYTFRSNGLFDNYSKTLKVKAKSSKTVEDLPVFMNNNYIDRMTYSWKATYEAALSNNDINYLQSLENGNFNLEDCGNKEIAIDE